LSKLQVLSVILVVLIPGGAVRRSDCAEELRPANWQHRKSGDKTLVIKTDFASEVAVQWPAVQEISSTQPLHVSLNKRADSCDNG
jgi:hypothetical protein